VRFWQRDKELRRLAAELRAARHEAPRDFLPRLVGREPEPRWLTKRLRIGVAVAIAALALAAIASAGGGGVIKDATKAAVHVVKRTTHTSAPQRVSASPASNQYRGCGGAGEPRCRITIFDASVRERDSGLTLITFTVSLDATPDAPVTVDYFTSNGSAVGGTACGPGIDYISQAGTLFFPAGTASRTITVQVCGDTLPEGNETFYVNLCCQSPNADIYRNRATGTIINDDH
jgi:hypothetical protein